MILLISVKENKRAPWMTHVCKYMGSLWKNIRGTSNSGYHEREATGDSGSGGGATYFSPHIQQLPCSLPVQRVQARPLGREMRSHLPCSQKTKT